MSSAGKQWKNISSSMCSDSSNPCQRNQLLIFRDRHGSLNVLVNNASKQYSCSDFAQIDLEKVEDIFQSNILQMIAITKYALPHLSKGDAYVSVVFLSYRPVAHVHLGLSITPRSLRSVAQAGW